MMDLDSFFLYTYRIRANNFMTKDTVIIITKLYIVQIHHFVKCFENHCQCDIFNGTFSFLIKVKSLK